MTDHYVHTNTKGVIYHLHKKEVTLRGGRKQMIYFFRKKLGEVSAIDHKPYETSLLPEGMIVRENPRNGFLTIGKYENRVNREDQD